MPRVTSRSRGNTSVSPKPHLAYLFGSAYASQPLRAEGRDPEPLSICPYAILCLIYEERTYRSDGRKTCSSNTQHNGGKAQRVHRSGPYQAACEKRSAILHSTQDNIISSARSPNARPNARASYQDTFGLLLCHCLFFQTRHNMAGDL